jgi:hypothetical protein
MGSSGWVYHHRDCVLWTLASIQSDNERRANAPSARQICERNVIYQLTLIICCVFSSLMPTLHRFLIKVGISGPESKVDEYPSWPSMPDGHIRRIHVEILRFPISAHWLRKSPADVGNLSSPSSHVDCRILNRISGNTAVIIWAYVIRSGVATAGSAGSMNRGPRPIRAPGRPQSIFFCCNRKENSNSNRYNR